MEMFSSKQEPFLILILEAIEKRCDASCRASGLAMHVQNGRNNDVNSGQSTSHSTFIGFRIEFTR